MNKIIIELSAEDRERIDRLTAALEYAGTATALQHIGEGTEKSTITAAPEMFEKAPETEAAAEPTTTVPWDVRDLGTPKTKPTEPTNAPAPQVSKADVQKKVVDLASKGKKDQVKGIITAYATKVSDIPEDKLAEVLDKLNALEG
jgi:hypothetical protein